MIKDPCVGISKSSIKGGGLMFMEELVVDFLFYRQGPLSHLSLLSNTVNLRGHELPSCVLKPQTCYYRQLCLLVIHLLSVVIKVPKCNQ